MSMVGYNLYLVSKDTDPQTGEEFEEDPYFLRLSYASYREAANAVSTLELVYGKDQIQIDCKSTGIPEIGD